MPKTANRSTKKPKVAEQNAKKLRSERKKAGWTVGPACFECIISRESYFLRPKKIARGLAPSFVEMVIGVSTVRSTGIENSYLSVSATVMV